MALHIIEQWTILEYDLHLPTEIVGALINICSTGYMDHA
jgi:hypothetical protein